MTAAVNIERGAAYFSDDRRHRYALSRVWDAGLPMLLFIGLNPSTADETKLDPTLRRVVGFAKREGCGGFWMGNLFTYRSTSPAAMKREAEPNGPEADQWLADMAKWCRHHIVVGWGSHGAHRGRDKEVRRVLQGYDVRCLGFTQGGQPRHPLYLPKDAPLVRFQGWLWRPGP